MVDRNYDCVDCGSFCGIYMVDDLTWARAGLVYRDNACLPCLHKRLLKTDSLVDRGLQEEHFTDVPGNINIRFAWLRGAGRV